MSIKANHKHFRKAHLVVVLCFAVCSTCVVKRTCIMKSDIGAYIIIQSVGKAGMVSDLLSFPW